MENKADLKAIWGKLNDLQLEVGKMIGADNIESVYNQLKKEQDRKKKWMPFMVPYIFAIMAFIAWVSEAHKDIVSMVGIAMITIGGFIMMNLLNMHEIPIDEYEHDKDSTTFLTLVKEKLEKRKTTWAIGVALYILLLLGGLHLLIFGLESLAGKGGELGILYGMMFGLMGMATGNMYVLHKKQYGEILKTIDRFLTD